ncbi:MAG: hypothetical protein PHQ96_01235 [Candidatus Omnitrophica bacterium]|nr:hypothetical protein [Candidatus Omnitrophota bacterium]
MNNKLPILILAIVYIFIALPRVMFPDLDHGEEWGDSEAMIAGINFEKLGFIKTHFLPLLRLHEEKPKFYTHYPGLSQILTGVYRRLFHFNSLYPYRTIAVIVSFIGVLFWYLTIKLITRSCFAGILASLFYLFNPFFIYSMDNIASLSYAAASRNLCIFTFIYAAHQAEEKRKKYLMLLWFLLVIDSFITFEYILFLASFFVLFKIFFKRKDASIKWRTIFCLFSAPVFGFFLHFAQNVWHFGSIGATLADFKDIVLKRTVQTYDTSQAINLKNWIDLVLIRNFNLVFLFPYFVLFLGLFFTYVVYQNLSAASRKEIKPFSKLFLILTLCGITWYIAFPAHSIAHAFVLFLPIHLLLCAAAGFSLFFYLIYLYIRQNKKNTVLKISVWCIAVVFVLFSGVTKSDLPVTRANIEKAEDFIIFRNCLLTLKKMAKEGDTIGVNYYRSPFMHYYTQRSIQNVFDKNSLEKLPALPQYFILIPYSNAPTIDLYKELEQKYNQIMACPSGRFPSVFLKLKE